MQEKDILDRAFRNSLIEDYQKDQKIQAEGEQESAAEEDEAKSEI